MKVLIIYFSGTGNTARISELHRDEFVNQGEACELLPMEELTLGRQEIDLQDWDLIGLGFPVHAMDAPKIVYDFIKQLPAQRCNYFLFKTAGSPMLHGGSTYKIRIALANLGFKLVHEQLYVMPPNAFGAAKQSKVERRYYKAVELVKISVVEILSGMKRRIPEAPLSGLCYAFADLEKNGARQSSRRWTVSDACISCGLCERECPAANIKLQDGKPSFGDSCLLCLRCWWNCPTRAISHSFLKPFFLKEPYKLPED